MMRYSEVWQQQEFIPRPLLVNALFVAPEMYLQVTKYVEYLNHCNQSVLHQDKAEINIVRHL